MFVPSLSEWKKGNNQANALYWELLSALSELYQKRKNHYAISKTVHQELLMVWMWKNGKPAMHEDIITEVP